MASNDVSDDVNPLFTILDSALACAIFGLGSALTSAPASYVCAVLMLAFAVRAVRAIKHFRDDY